MARSWGARCSIEDPKITLIYGKSCLIRAGFGAQPPGPRPVRGRSIVAGLRGGVWVVQRASGDAVCLSGVRFVPHPIFAGPICERIRYSCASRELWRAENMYWNAIPANPCIRALIATHKALPWTPTSHTRTGRLIAPDLRFSWHELIRPACTSHSSELRRRSAARRPRGRRSGRARRRRGARGGGSR